VKFLIAAFAIFVSAHVCVAQSSFKLTVKDESTREPVIGATVTVKDTGISGTTDARGVVQLNNIPAPLSYDLVKLFAGYTFVHRKAAYLVGNQTLPLTPKSRMNSTLLFEKAYFQRDLYPHGRTDYQRRNQTQILINPSRLLPFSL